VNDSQQICMTTNHYYLKRMLTEDVKWPQIKPLRYILLGCFRQNLFIKHALFYANHLIYIPCQLKSMYLDGFHCKLSISLGFMFLTIDLCTACHMCVYLLHTNDYEYCNLIHRSTLTFFLILPII
jgi:hypothetical protein